jgi:hypothetical protein
MSSIQEGIALSPLVHPLHGFTATRHDESEDEMAQVVHTGQPTERERKRLGYLVGGGTTAEAIAGVGAATLAILGLAGILPFYMLMIGIIAAGAALFIEGVSVGGAYAKLHNEQVLYTEAEDQLGTSTGLSVQVLGGATAIVLGILGLVGLFPGTLAAIAVIALGAALLLGGPARAELNWSALELRHASNSSRVLATQAVHGASGILALVGLGAVVLGILALVATAPPASATASTLVLVAVLAIGAAELLGGSSILGRIAVGARH